MAHGCCGGYWKKANFLGLYFLLWFGLCFAWYYLNPVEQELQLKLWRISFWGFEEMNMSGFWLGALQSYLLGYLALGLWRVLACVSLCGSEHEKGQSSCCDKK